MTNTKLVWAAMFLGLSVGTAPASAQINDLIELDYTPSGDDIIVTRKPDPEPKPNAVRKQARAITDATNIFEQPLAMFQNKICPGVSGLPEELALFIADRMRQNIDQLELDLGDPDTCQPNLLVSFVLNGQSAVQALKNKPGSLLSYLPKHERDELMRDPGPVHAWQLISIRTRDGVAAQFDNKERVAVLQTQSSNSLFLLNVRRDIEFSIVIIDIPAIDGMNAKQIADYATMRGLAKTRAVSGDSEYGTILNLFDPDALHPAELTNFDRAYLKNLYSNMPNLPAASKLGGIKGIMRKQLASVVGTVENP